MKRFPSLLPSFLAFGFSESPLGGPVVWDHLPAVPDENGFTGPVGGMFFLEPRSVRKLESSVHREILQTLHVGIRPENGAWQNPQQIEHQRSPL